MCRGSLAPRALRQAIQRRRDDQGVPRSAGGCRLSAGPMGGPLCGCVCLRPLRRSSCVTGGHRCCCSCYACDVAGLQGVSCPAARACEFYHGVRACRTSDAVADNCAGHSRDVNVPSVPFVPSRSDSAGGSCTGDAARESLLFGGHPSPPRATAARCRASRSPCPSSCAPSTHAAAAGRL